RVDASGPPASARGRGGVAALRGSGDARAARRSGDRLRRATMAETPRWRRYLRLWGPDPDADIEDELRFHLEMREQEYLAAGFAPEEARRRALERLGDLDAVRAWLRRHDRKKQKRAARVRAAGDLLQDVRYGVRKLWQEPGFSAAVVAVLALGDSHVRGGGCGAAAAVAVRARRAARHAGRVGGAVPEPRRRVVPQERSGPDGPRLDARRLLRVRGVCARQPEPDGGGQPRACERHAGHAELLLDAGRASRARPAVHAGGRGAGSAAGGDPLARAMAAAVRRRSGRARAYDRAERRAVPRHRRDAARLRVPRRDGAVDAAPGAVHARRLRAVPHVPA